MLNIIVCLKQVPDTEASIKIDSDQKTIAESGIKFILNPYDEFAVEAALQIKESQGAGTITAITLGPDRVQEALRTAVAMGVDEVIHLQTQQSFIDPAIASQVLSDKIKAMPFDLILMGKEAIDDGAMQVGPMLAERLNIPCLTVATKLQVAGQTVTIEREIEGGAEVLEAPLPCVVTCQKGLNEPRFPSIRGVMMAKKKVIAPESVTLANNPTSIAAFAYPPSRSGSKIVGEGAGAADELVRLLREEVKIL